MTGWTATRRSILAAAGLGWIGTVAAPASAIGILQVAGIAEAVKSAAEAVGKLAENLKIALTQGLAMWDIGTARAARDRMITLSRTLTFFATEAQSVLAATFEDYIVTWENAGGASGRLAVNDKAELSRQWAEIKSKLAMVLDQVAKLLATLNKEDGLFVATPAYTELVTTLGGRANLLGKLRNVDPPMTPAEVARLREIAAAYAVLRANLRKAIDGLNVYIKQS